MGYFCHNVIVVIGFQEDAMEAARIEADRLFAVQEYGGVLAPVSAVLKSPTNLYYSIMVGPDGSKEGWDTSQRGDVARNAFIEWLTEGHAPNHYFSWAEVAFPEDGEAHVSHSN